MKQSPNKPANDFCPLRGQPVTGVQYATHLRGGWAACPHHPTLLHDTPPKAGRRAGFPQAAEATYFFLPQLGRMTFMVLLGLSCLFFNPSTLRASNQINVVIPTNTLEHSVSGSAVTDCINLLQKACQCVVAPIYKNAFDGQIEIRLPEIDPKASKLPTDFARTAKYPYLKVPIRRFTWKGEVIEGRRILTLIAPTAEAVSAGIYGLMQELLGFQFYHPKETYIPNIDQWPLPDEFVFTGNPRFDKMGFHLHTQHPLELTEPLLDHKLEGGIDEVKEYIDWLARNSQNYFEFNLLEGVSRKHWPQHAKQMVDYAHSRGILAGVDISLHMIQQKSWMLYKLPLKSFLSKEKQVKKNLDWLLQADWDVLNMELSTTEFTSGNQKKKAELQLYIVNDLLERDRITKLMSRKHVVQQSNELSKKKHDYQLTQNQREMDVHRGELPHTVMFYGLLDESAPVYGNENLKHMLRMLKQKLRERETWYYPESAYWVTFDNSVPIFLTNYLDTRLEDLLLVDSLRTPGHLTFSSGWEWGYWLFDWSIARWSWEYKWNGNSEPLTPGMYPAKMARNLKTAKVWRELIEMQNQFLKERELIRYLCAQTITDEIGGPFNLQLHPRPIIPYKEMRRKPIGRDTLIQLKNNVLPGLRNFAETSDKMVGNLEKTREGFPPELRHLVDEWVDGVKITGMRALHRYYVLNHILLRNQAKFNRNLDIAKDMGYLNKAKSVRVQAMGIVKRREAAYRYPVQRIGRKRKGHTAYHFGYLYPVSELHFWEREELQARKNHWGPFFRNIWNVPRIIGVVD